MFRNRAAALAVALIAGLLSPAVAHADEPPRTRLRLLVNATSTEGVVDLYPVLELEGPEGWYPLGSQAVTVGYDGSAGISTFTGERVSVSPGRTRSWWARYDGQNRFTPAEVKVDLPYPFVTRLEATGWPTGPVHRNTEFQVLGRLSWPGYDAQQPNGMMGAGLLSLEYSSDKQRWFVASTDRLATYGRTAFPRGAFVQEGYWRLHYWGSPHSAESVSVPVHLTMAPDRTRLSFTADAKKSRQVKVSGDLLDLDDQRMLPKRKLKIYFRASSRKAWTYVTTTVTNARGLYAATLKNRRSGYWRVVFTGNQHAASTTSKTKWVKIK
ncbi:hypothetical protein GCM10027589_36670 [Actinocorallia lasiicapitis]